MMSDHTTTLLQGSFCKNIRALRNERQWKQKDLASRMSITVSCVSKMEAGTTCVTLSAMRQIASIYEVPLSDLLKPPGEPLKKIADLRELTLLKEKLAICEEEIPALRQKIIALYEELRYINIPA